jgi:hypothetical protein
MGTTANTDKATDHDLRLCERWRWDSCYDASLPCTCMPDARYASPPAAPQPAPDAGGEWRVELSTVQGYYIVDGQGNEVIRDAHAPRSVFEQIVADHTLAVIAPELISALAVAHKLLKTQQMCKQSLCDDCNEARETVLESVETVLATTQGREKQ